MKNGKLKVLVELRACLEGFSGIPMETRLVFRSLTRMEGIEATGLINHPSKYLTRGLSPGVFGAALTQDRAISRLSRLAISVKADPLPTFLGKLWLSIEKRLEHQLTQGGTCLGTKIRVHRFDASEFGDFMWQSFFSNTLPAGDYETMRTARYASIRPSTVVLRDIAIRWWQSVFKWLPLPCLDTRNYDVFVSQMPWPTRLAPKTQLVVRYHDAIPVFLPHTVEHPAFHQAAHLSGLEVCEKRAVFACNSEATRADLLKIYPHLEHRAVVVPDIVSKQYFQEKANHRYLVKSMRRHICQTTEPKFLTPREKERFYERHLMPAPLRYLLMVSSIDLRKNHAKLIAAWDYLRTHGMPDLKLVIVGELGWEYQRIVTAMIPAIERGKMFHLTKVPFGQLRIIYRAAAAVVCPSVAEGFDLSGVEAMLCGGAVVASDIPVHREVYGNACEYFNPYSTMDLARAIERVVGADSVRRREELVEAGLRHAPRYKSENIEPIWQELFERIRMGDFKRRKGLSRPLAPARDLSPAHTPPLEPATAPEHAFPTGRDGEQAETQFVDLRERR
jgi:glycosyltransferase involved in cell wall biosynthesis